MDFERIKARMGRQLDRDFDKINSPFAKRLNDLFDNDLIELRLLQVLREAQRLHNEGKELTMSNPVVKQFFFDYAVSLVKAQVFGQQYGTQFQRAGFRAGADITRFLAGVGTDPRWKMPTLDAMEAALSFTNNKAYGRLFPNLSIEIQNTLKNIILNGIATGQNPRKTAGELKDMAGFLPRYRYEAIMRTTQLTAYRESAAFNQTFNRDIIEYQIRYATLDARTCVACIALHGQELPAGERIDDHYNGRCVGVPKVTFIARPEIETGIAWFERLPESQQRAYFHNDKLYNGYKNGEYTLPEIVGVKNDPVFGKMTEQRSYVGIKTGSSEQYKLPERKTA